MTREEGSRAESVLEREDKIPLVSVIIPAYNAETYVGEAIESVLAQDYPNKEVIVVNDGSTDGTSDVLDEYRGLIRRVDQINAGAAGARNEGLKQSQGEFIGFLDADDVWLPGKLTIQVAYLERNPEIDMVQGCWQVWTPRDGVFRSPADEAWLPRADPESLPPLVRERSGWVYHRLLTEFMVCTDVVVARRRLVDQVGWFDCRLVCGEDFDYWLRASRLTQIHTLDRPMALYRQHDDNATHGCPRRNYAAEVIAEAVRRWGLEGVDGSRANARDVRRHLAKLWAGFAYKQLRAGQPRRAVVSLVRAASRQPLALRTWLLLGYSLLASARIVKPFGNRRESAL